MVLKAHAVKNIAAGRQAFKRELCREIGLRKCVGDGAWREWL